MIVVYGMSPGGDDKFKGFWGVGGEWVVDVLGNVSSCESLIGMVHLSQMEVIAYGYLYLNGPSAELWT